MNILIVLLMCLGVLGLTVACLAGRTARTLRDAEIKRDARGRFAKKGDA